MGEVNSQRILKGLDAKMIKIPYLRTRQVDRYGLTYHVQNKDETFKNNPPGPTVLFLICMFFLSVTNHITCKKNVEHIFYVECDLFWLLKNNMCCNCFLFIFCVFHFSFSYFPFICFIYSYFGERGHGGEYV